MDLLLQNNFSKILLKDTKREKNNAYQRTVGCQVSTRVPRTDVLKVPTPQNCVQTDGSV